MIELSPYYFSSTDQKQSFTIIYYPINKQWKIELTDKNKKIDYWLDKNQAKEIRDLLSESIQEIEESHNE